MVSGDGSAVPCEAEGANHHEQNPENCNGNKLVGLALGYLWSLVDFVRLISQRFVPDRYVPGLVSIPIATYDRDDVLVSRTIPSLLGSSYRNVEIIVICDGGPEIVRRSVEALGDDRISFIQLKKRSRYPSDPLNLWFVAGSRPRNRGAELSRGEFILWMSDDDIVLPNALESMVSYLRENPAIDAVGGTVQVGINNPSFNIPSRNPDLIGIKTGAMPAWLHRRRLRAFKWNAHSWRNHWNRPADYDLANRMLRKRIRFGAIDEVVVIQAEVADSGQLGSKGAIWEELRRRDEKR